MRFEYDPRKSEANFEKHGIDFEQAKNLWEGYVIEFVANVKGENRTKAIGRIDGEYWSAIYTMRNERIRIISVRPATMRERGEYDRYIND